MALTSSSNQDLLFTQSIQSHLIPFKINPWPGAAALAALVYFRMRRRTGRAGLRHAAATSFSMSSDQMYRPAEYQPPPFNPLPLAGWALIVGSAIYTLYVMVPPRFLDPQWEFDAMGMLANNSLLPLLGIALVLHGRDPVIGLQKLVVFRLLLIVCFTLAALNLFLIPLAAGDERRLTSAAQGEMATVQAAQTVRDKRIEKLINGAATIQDLTSMGAMLNLAPTPDERRVQHLDDNLDTFKKCSFNAMWRPASLTSETGPRSNTCDGSPGWKRISFASSR